MKRGPRDDEVRMGGQELSNLEYEMRVCAPTKKQKFERKKKRFTAMQHHAEGHRTSDNIEKRAVDTHQRRREASVQMQTKEKPKEVTAQLGNPRA